MKYWLVSLTFKSPSLNQKMSNTKTPSQNYDIQTSMYDSGIPSRFQKQKPHSKHECSKNTNHNKCYSEQTRSHVPSACKNKVHPPIHTLYVDSV